MSLLMRVLLALMLLGSVPSRAAEVEVGTGLACDTQSQVESYVALMSAGFAPQKALAAINDLAKKTACGVVTVAYVRGDRVATVDANEGRFEIVQIIVVAFDLGMRWRMVAPLPQFSLFKLDEGAA